MRGILAIRAVFFVVALPGTVAGYVPYRMLRASKHLQVPSPSLANMLAGTLVLVGVAVLLHSVWRFFASGHGTLAPVDPPVRLVVTGLYRYTRNPMYNGVVLVLLSEAWLFRSADLLAYAVAVSAAMHLFVVLYEERTLRARFGSSYEDYCAAVPRWGFTVHPYAEHGVGQRG